MGAHLWRLVVEKQALQNRGRGREGIKKNDHMGHIGGRFNDSGG